jgi:hypothetical protein
MLALKEISLEIFEREGESIYNDPLHLLKGSPVIKKLHFIVCTET